MGVVGIILFFAAFLQCYNVLFNKKSNKYWASTWDGNKFKVGCLLPILMLLASFGLISYEESQKKQTEEISQRANRDREIQRKNLEKVESKKYDGIVTADLKNFKKYVNENYKKLLVDRNVVERIKTEITKKTQDMKKTNEGLKKELAVLKRLDISEDERNKKISSINKRGRANQRKIKEMAKKYGYINSVFKDTEGNQK